MALITSMLTRDPDDRPAASDLLNSKWIRSSPEALKGRDLAVNHAELKKQSAALTEGWIAAVAKAELRASKQYAAAEATFDGQSGGGSEDQESWRQRRRIASSLLSHGAQPSRSRMPSASFSYASS